MSTDSDRACDAGESIAGRDRLVDDVWAAFRQVTFFESNAKYAAELVNRGWTPDLVHALGPIAQVALDRSCHIVRTMMTTIAFPNATAGPTTVDVVRWMVLEDVFRNGELPAPVTLDWLALMAITTDDDPRVHDRDGRRAYQEAVGENLAPLAVAAGLTPDEAREGLTAGTLNEDIMRVLAGLRGFPIVDRRR